MWGHLLWKNMNMKCLNSEPLKLWVLVSFFISNFYRELLFLWNYKLKKIMKYKQTGIGIYKIDITVTWIKEPLSFLWAFWPPSRFRWSLLLYTPSSVHPPPTLVSHPCPYSSARPIGHSFWRFVSCCGLYRTVQGSHPHQWG